MRRDREAQRRFQVAGELWSVSERDTQSVPGARAPKCLVFESQAAVRRAWSYPGNWRDMDDSALWRLSELTASKSALIEGMTRAFISSIVAQRRASDLISTARASLEQNRAMREQRKALIQQCRVARRESHDGVANYARDARAAGKSESDVLDNLDAPLGQAAFVVNDPQRSARLISDVKRWCNEAFNAA